MWIYTGNKLTKFHGNILSLSENIAKRFRRATVFDSHSMPFVGYLSSIERQCSVL